MSRIELDGPDRASVDSVREMFAEAEAADYGDLTDGQRAERCGRLEACVAILLRVLDRPEAHR